MPHPIHTHSAGAWQTTHEEQSMEPAGKEDAAVPNDATLAEMGRNFTSPLTAHSRYKNRAPSCTSCT